MFNHLGVVKVGDITDIATFRLTLEVMAKFSAHHVL